ncbi:MAG: methionine adenosyltransferase [Clostridia bacterium]|nr:methionine adenosyltransferase [Clostridia bacterium]
MITRLFTSESVTEGHPDKVCDSISDALLDAVLTQDPEAHCACETCATTDKVVVMGETRANATVDVDRIVRETVDRIGYNIPGLGFDSHTLQVYNFIHEQSSDIAQGVDQAGESRHSEPADQDEYDRQGAGDQGMMYGYACDETAELMPLPITLAHRLTAKLTEVRKNGTLPYLRPDGKAQVTVEYEGHTPIRVHTVVVSTQHDESVTQEQIREDIIEYVICEAIPAYLMQEATLIYVNPTGRFVIGGPDGDSGLTGRKIIVDTYGGYCPHGGGAFSGKDPTKVDRSAAYYARYVCKNVVAAGLARHCQLEVSYAIGRAHPISLRANTFGTGVVDDSILEEVVDKVFDFRPAAIIDQLDLKRPIYSKTTNYGHFGKADLPWEKTDKVHILQKEIMDWK